MAGERTVLLVAATASELGRRQGLVCGVGPVEAAAATARALAEAPPLCVVNVGVAGGRSLAPETVVVGTEAAYVDLAAAIPVVDRVLPDPGLRDAVAAALPAARILPIATSAAVGVQDGPSLGFPVEGMEGFGVLRACELAGVPAVEVRVISNEVGEDDRSKWRIAAALERLHAILPAILAAAAPADEG